MKKSTYYILAFIMVLCKILNKKEKPMTNERKRQRT